MTVAAMPTHWRVPTRRQERQLRRVGRTDGRRGLPMPGGEPTPTIQRLRADAEQVVAGMGAQLWEELEASQAEAVKATKRLLEAHRVLSDHLEDVRGMSSAGDCARNRRERRAAEGRVRDARADVARRRLEFGEAMTARDLVVETYRDRAWGVVRYFEDCAARYAAANLAIRTRPRHGILAWLADRAVRQDQLPVLPDAEQFAVRPHLPDWVHQDPRIDVAEPDTPAITAEREGRGGAHR